MKPYGLRKGAWTYARNDVDTVLIARPVRARRANRRAIEDGERNAANMGGMHEEIDAHACEAGLPCPTCLRPSRPTAIFIDEVHAMRRGDLVVGDECAPLVRVLRAYAIDDARKAGDDPAVCDMLEAALYPGEDMGRAPVGDA